jgi:sigma-B regulation protein RsbU (phosphoserine phosphatase)
VRRWRDVQERDADKELAMASSSLATAVGDVLDANVRAVTATAGQIGIVNSKEKTVLYSLLHRYRDQFPACLGVLIADPDGQRYASDPDGPPKGNLTDRSYYQLMRSTGRTTISDVEVGRFTGVPTIHVCAPMWAAEGERTQFLGSVVAALSLEYLSELAATTSAPFGAIRVIVTDARSRVIADSAMRHPILSDLSSYPLYAAPDTGQTMARQGRDEHSTLVRGASTRVLAQGAAWTVTVLKPSAVIEEQARRAFVSTVVVLIAALTLGVSLALWLSYRLARPILRLARYAFEVSHGSSGESPASAASDPREVHQLNQAVAAMVTRLRQQADTIRAQAEEKLALARLRQEMEIATRIQTSLLPSVIELQDFEVAARMVPAESVGGDYYDFVPAQSHCWVSIGDVSGHGLNAGLVMMMVQSALGAVIARSPDARPGEVLRAVNQLLVENVRRRLHSDEHVTLALLWLMADGRFVFAGGHEPTLVVRARSGTVDHIENVGPWLGIDLWGPEPIPEGEGHLDPGDLLVLHSDGVVESGIRSGRPYGIEGLEAALRRLRDEPLPRICKEIIDESRARTPGPADDDMTIVVIRYVGPEPEGGARGVSPRPE